MGIKGGKKEGVLSSQQIKRAIEEGIIRADQPIEDSQIQPASIDLRCGSRVFRLVSSFLPESMPVMDRLHTPDAYGSDLVMYEMDISNGGILERGSVYLIPLMEELSLPADVDGKANPKSTTGRLDIFARVITDNNPRFDEVPAGYRGRLFVEVLPRSFTIKIKAGQSLVQLRLRKGSAQLEDGSLKRLNARYSLLYDGSKPLSTKDVRIANGLFMSVDLTGDDSNGIIGYKSKKNSHVIDLSRVGYYNAQDFWEPIYRNPKDTLILEPEEFYILASKERIRVPSGYAAEMVPYEVGSGELRTHYAGFFDPGFGYGAKGEVLGTKAVLEVRAHDVPFMVVHGQTFCKLYFERMSTLPDKVYGPKIGSSYQYQTISLSKQFKKG